MTEPNSPTAKPSGFGALSALVDADMKRVNQTILDKMHSPVALIPQLASHLIAAGGKRIRPMLTLASARLAGYDGDRHVVLAACIEFLHTATLLHDDVVDESDLRRGQASANAVFGNKPSVLVGDFLFSRAFELMVADGSLRVLEILSRTSAILAEGEVLQLMTTNDTDTSEETYLEVIRSKTASLFSAACRIGGVTAGVPTAQENALADYGMNLGIAFQLVDDLLDYSAHQATLGKTVGDDFAEGKLTLPVILAFQRGDEAERAFWTRTLVELDQKDSDLAHAQGLLARHNVLADTATRARFYADQAKKSLSGFPDSPLRQAMLDVVDFCVERAY